MSVGPRSEPIVTSFILRIHAPGERTGTGNRRSLCNQGMIEGPWGRLRFSERMDEVNCQKCRERSK